MNLDQAFSDMTDKVTGQNQLAVVQKQQSQQDQVIDLEKQRLALLSGTLTPSGSNVGMWVGIIAGVVVVGALVYFFVIKKKLANS